MSKDTAIPEFAVASRTRYLRTVEYYDYLGSAF